MPKNSVLQHADIIATNKSIDYLCAELSGTKHETTNPENHHII